MDWIQCNSAAVLDSDLYSDLVLLRVTVCYCLQLQLIKIRAMENTVRPNTMSIIFIGSLVGITVCMERMI